jgi:hypothetical protein
MVSANYDKTFNNLSIYESVVMDYSSEGSAIIWLKNEGGERFVEVSRVKGLWEKIFTIGLVNTIKSWFNRGDASLRAVTGFLSQNEVKQELKSRYLALNNESSISGFDKSIRRLNSHAAVRNLGPLDINISRAERETQAQNVAKESARTAEIQRKYAEERRQEEAKEAEKRQKELESQPRPPSFPEPRPYRPSSTGNSSSYVSMSQTVNGVTTSYAGTFDGSCDVRMENGRVTVNGRIV